MSFTISKEFAWSSSHQLEGLPPEHQCARLHGHNYVARVELSSDVLDEVGFVIDYGDLWFVKDYIDGTWDHRHLNEVLDFNPTAERMAKHLCQVIRSTLVLAGLERVRVAVAISETPKTWATYREDS